MRHALTLPPVMAGHLQSLRWKTHRHAAVAFHLERIAEATEILAVLADLNAPPAVELAEWTGTMKRGADALASAVASLHPHNLRRQGEPPMTHALLYQILMEAEERATGDWPDDVKARSLETVALCHERMRSEGITRDQLRRLALT